MMRRNTNKVDEYKTQRLQEGRDFDEVLTHSVPSNYKASTTTTTQYRRPTSTLANSYLNYASLKKKAMNTAPSKPAERTLTASDIPAHILQKHAVVQEVTIPAHLIAPPKQAKAKTTKSKDDGTSATTVTKKKSSANANAGKAQTGKRKQTKNGSTTKSNKKTATKTTKALQPKKKKTTDYDDLFDSNITLQSKAPPAKKKPVIQSKPAPSGNIRKPVVRKPVVQKPTPKRSRSEDDDSILDEDLTTGKKRPSSSIRKSQSEQANRRKQAPKKATTQRYESSEDEYEDDDDEEEDERDRKRRRMSSPPRFHMNPYMRGDSFESNFRDEIRGMFRKKHSHSNYYNDDIYSDDDDIMEARMADIDEEEEYTARAGEAEDQRDIAEEKRRRKARAERLKKK
jgi:hypothetical protein